MRDSTALWNSSTNCSSSRCCGGVLAVDRPDASDVADVVAVVRREVHQHQVAVLERRGVAEVVHVVDVLGAARGNRAIAFEPRVVDQEDVARRRIELILGHARLGAAHRFHQPEPGNLRGAPHHRDLARALDAPHLVEDGIEVPHLGARMTRAQQLDEPALTRPGAVPRVVDARGFRRHELAAALSLVLGRAELREDHRRRLAASASAGAGAAGRDQRPVGVDHLLQRLDLVRAGDAHDEIGVFRRQHAAFGRFEPRVARRAGRSSPSSCGRRAAGTRRASRCRTGNRRCCADEGA